MLDNLVTSVYYEQVSKKRKANQMSLYNLELKEDGVLHIGFGDPAGNDAIVPEAVQKAEQLKEQVMGKVLRINGPASLPVAVAISHVFSHIVPAVACWDPKLSAYVVCVSHDPNYSLGQLIQ